MELILLPFIVAGMSVGMSLDPRLSVGRNLREALPGLGVSAGMFALAWLIGRVRKSEAPSSGRRFSIYLPLAWLGGFGVVVFGESVWRFLVNH